MTGLAAGALVGTGIWLMLAHVSAGDLWRTVRAAGCVCLAGAAGLVVTGLASVGVVAAGTAAVLVAGVPRRRRRREQQARANAWPDAIDIIRSSVRTGSTLPEALAAPAASGPECLRPLFQSYRDRLVLTGSFDQSLALLARDPVGARVATVMKVSATVGSADVGRVLDALSEFLRADKANDQQIRARQSWNVAAARLAVAAPWVTVLVMSARPTARAAYATTAGTMILFGVGLASAAAYWLMVQTTSTSRQLP
jgi:tight adherence protein B